MQSKPQPHRVTQGSNDHLWFRILALYLRHDLGALFWCDSISAHSDLPSRLPCILGEHAYGVTVRSRPVWKTTGPLLTNESTDLQIQRLGVVVFIGRMMTALMAIRTQRNSIGDAVGTFFRERYHVVDLQIR